MVFNSIQFSKIQLSSIQFKQNQLNSFWIQFGSYLIQVSSADSVGFGIKFVFVHISSLINGSIYLLIFWSARKSRKDL